MIYYKQQYNILYTSYLFWQTLLAILHLAWVNGEWLWLLVRLNFCNGLFNASHIWRAEMELQLNVKILFIFCQKESQGKNI